MAANPMQDVEAFLDSARASAPEANGSRNGSRAGSDFSPRRKSRSDRDRSPDSRGSGGGRRSEHRSSRRHDDDRRRYRSRSRSRSPAPRRRDDSRERRDYDRRRDDRRGSYDRDDRRSSRRRSRSRTPPRQRRTSPKYEKEKEVVMENGEELPEEEREMRSVFVSQLSNRVDDRMLANFFENVVQVGAVREAKVIVDRISRRSKGVGYVEFRDVGTVTKALAASGTKLLGIPMKIEYTEAEKNRLAMASNTPANGPLHIPIGPGSDASPASAIPYNRLYIGSLNFSLTDNDIKSVFTPFGPVDICELHKDPGTGKSKGYGFVQFKKLADAKQAFEKMNGFMLAGRQLQIRVGLSNEKGSAANAFRNETTLEEGGGTQLNNISRLELMNKLARNEVSMIAPQAPMYRVNVPTATSDAILLKNLFSPAEETEPNFDLDLRDDVRSECESKYGKVVDIYVDKESAQGEVYIKFADMNAATMALTGLNGRFFGGRTISASYISDAIMRAATGQRG